MTFIPKKIRLLPLSVALITALSLGTSVFSAATLQPPITTYDAGTQKVTVSSTVDGVANNEEVTYLVKQTLTPYDIIFIDQKNSLLTTSVTFSFTTAYTNLNYAATVNFGTATTAKNTPAVPDLFLTRSITGSNTALGTRVSNDSANNLLCFGTLTNSTTGLDKIESDNAIEEYGILFADNNNYSSLNSISTIAGLDQTTTIKKFPAWGKNATGQFAVNLVNGGSSLLQAGTTCHTRTYVKYKKEGTATYIEAFGPVRTIGL